MCALTSTAELVAIPDPERDVDYVDECNAATALRDAHDRQLDDDEWAAEPTREIPRLAMVEEIEQGVA
jgi:hypothetical protein